MIYTLWVGNAQKACTSNLVWLLNEAIPFHKNLNHSKAAILITSAKG
jgi:hypothetical protein